MQVVVSPGIIKSTRKTQAQTITRLRESFRKPTLQSIFRLLLLPPLLHCLLVPLTLTTDYGTHHDNDNSAVTMAIALAMAKTVTMIMVMITAITLVLVVKAR